jgi:hypothetical protein
MKLTLCCGLLFTAPLIPASSAEHSGPIPHPLLHVRKIERGSDVSVSIVDDASSASTVHADNRTSRDSPSCSVSLVESVPETEAPVAAPLDDDAIDMFALHDDASGVSCGCGALGASSCACFSANDTDSHSLLPCAESESMTTDLPFQCDCCQMELPQDDIMSSSIAEKMLLFQRFGSQFDVPLKDLHLHALGVPIFDSSCPSVCGHQCPDHTDFPPETASNSPSTPDESVDIAHSDAPPAYMEPGDEYVLCHLTRDQLRILWHQRLGHIHSRRVSKMHKHADGIPPVLIATELDTCPVCAHAKLHKAARGPTPLGPCHQVPQAPHWQAHPEVST